MRGTSTVGVSGAGMSESLLSFSCGQVNIRLIVCSRISKIERTAYPVYSSYQGYNYYAMFTVVCEATQELM